MSEVQDLLLLAVALQTTIPTDPANPEAWVNLAGDFYHECMDGGEIRPTFFAAIPMRNRGEFRRAAETLDAFSHGYQASDESTARAAIKRVIDILKSADARPAERGAWRRFPPEQRDDLLPLARKKIFEEDLPRAISEASRDEPLALIATDIDHFKAVNDKHGHLPGDEVLKSIGAIHELVCRGRGKAYRVGGEELAILAPNTTPEEALALSERLRGLVAGLVIPAIGGSVTLSAGVAVTTDPRSSTIHTDADGALYKAKQSGRNRVILHGASSASAMAIAAPVPLVQGDGGPVLEARPQGCPADIPMDVFLGIRKKCEADWPDDFRMRLHCETTQFDAYRRLHEPTPVGETFGPEATALLRAAAENGEIALLETDQVGKWLNAGREDFVDSSDPAVAARYLDALELLVKLGLARRESSTLFMLTGMGFEKARALKG
jgi:diguanylate cyclase (GGDEF)-like protein